jgi:predicted transcriptional regulator
MTTTTIRLEDDLKARVAAVAEREGKTAHAFILEAISQTVELAELDADFQRVAEERCESRTRHRQDCAQGKTARRISRDALRAGRRESQSPASFIPDSRGWPHRAGVGSPWQLRPLHQRGTG